MMDLFSAMGYDGIENRNSVLLLAVIDNLSEDARAAFLQVVTPTELGSHREIRAQHGVAVGVLDGWLRWPGRCAIVMEAKVNDPLGSEQPERYAAWLAATYDDPVRVLWLVTRGRPDVRALIPTLKFAQGVTVAWTTWTILADHAQNLAERASTVEVDRLLLNALRTRLQKEGIAASPIPPLDLEAVALAVGLLPHVRTFRLHMLRWLQEIPWLSGWKREKREVAWAEISVYAHRALVLANPDATGKKRWVQWWAEIWAPGERSLVWPEGQRYGVRLRVGVWFNGAATADFALEPLRACLGTPAAASHRDYQAASDYHPYTYDRGTYHEVWWLVPFNPADLPATAEGLRLAMEDQARRMAPLIAGGLATVAVAP